MIRTPFRYYGGKWRAAPRYPPPEHGLIIEPFAGAAGYACRYSDRDVLLIDRSPTIAGIWAWLIGATRSDVLDLPGPPDGGAVDDIDAPQGARDLVGFWMNNGASAPSKRPSRWVRDRPDKCGWEWARTRVAEIVDGIRHWKVQCGTYTDAPGIEATWFVDPPYQTPAGRHYPFSDVDYEHLGRWCQSRPGQVIVCEQAGADWLPFRHFGHVKPTAGRHRSARNDEVIWTSTPQEQVALWPGGAMLAR